MKSKNKISKKIDYKAEQLRIDRLRAKFLVYDTEGDDVKYQTIIDYCKQHDTTFHDGEFPLTKENLGEHLLKKGDSYKWIKLVKKKTFSDKKSYKIEFLIDKIKCVNYATWRRPIIFTKVPSASGTSEWKTSCADVELNQQCENFWIFHYLCYPNPVCQNGIGNCALIASLYAVSDRISIIKSIFRRPGLCVYGVYQLKLCMEGEWKTVTIDDWMPALERSSRDTGSNVAMLGKHQFWPSLIEKAIAKMLGGYDGINGISAQNALTCMTGAPLNRFRTIKKNQKKLWMVMREASSKKFPMTVGTYSKKKVKFPKGLNENHGYTLIKCIELFGHKLLQIRDPWGISGWTGKWSSSWNGFECEQTIKSIHPRDFISGSFWIDYDDFFKYFDIVVISRYREEWDDIRVNMSIGGLWDGTQVAIKVTVPRTCEICVTAIRPKYRHISNITWISCHRIDSDSPTDIGEIIFCGPTEYSSEDVHLEPGEYMILLSRFYYSTIKEERNVAIHSSIPICAKLCSLRPEMLVGVYQKMVSEVGRDILKHRKDISIKKWSNEIDTFLIVMAENYNYDKYLHVHIRCQDCETWYMSRGYNDNPNYGDVVPPRCSQILLVIYRSVLADQTEFPMNIEYYLSHENKTKMRRSERAAHIPEIKPSQYIHQTVAME